MKKLIIFLAAALTVFVSASVRADADELAGPVKSILEHYSKIHSQLIKDSIRGVSSYAAAIAATVKNDESKSLPPKLGQDAEALSKAPNLAAAREAFKSLSDSLIKYLDETKAGKGAYHQAYCPMAKASWLQTGKDVKNPYMGKDMLECGEFKN